MYKYSVHNICELYIARLLLGVSSLYKLNIYIYNNAIPFVVYACFCVRSIVGSARKPSVVCSGITPENV